MASLIHDTRAPGAGLAGAPRVQGPRLPHWSPPGRLADARIWQIVSLGLLLAIGIGGLGFDQSPAAAGVVVATAIATQWVFTRAIGLGALDPLSPLITALSLSILLRAGDTWVLALAAFLAIASKFVIRWDGKHIFNPANFAISVLLLASDHAWISPAQWGSQAWYAFLFVCLAMLVLSRAKRADVALAFLGTYVMLLVLRALYLGDPLAIPLKQMQSGAVLLFAFFMISDPKTTPDRRLARILYGALVATAAHVLVYIHYDSRGLMLALFFASPLVPLLDRWMPRLSADRFHWSRPLVQ